MPSRRIALGHTTLARPMRRSQESRPPRPTLRAGPGVRAGLRRAAMGVARKRRSVAGVRAGVLTGANRLGPPRRMPAAGYQIRIPLHVAAGVRF